MEPRAAATIVVVREAPEGIEVLALRRGAASRLLPGFVVFPGGTVDAGDAALAERWFGSPHDAARACAVRELAEEAGLVLLGPGIRPLVDGEDPLEAVSTAPPPAERIPEIARWLAPEFLPVRFDARFFAAEGGRDVDPRADGTEIDRAWWARPGELLSAFHADRASLAWPTLKTLEGLAACGSVDDALALRVEQVPPPLTGS